MQHKTVYLLFCKFTLHVSGINLTPHQEYKKLYLQPPVLCSYLPPPWPSLDWLGLATFVGSSCTVPEAVDTVLCNPDDGCG